MSLTLDKFARTSRKTSSSMYTLKHVNQGRDGTTLELTIQVDSNSTSGKQETRATICGLNPVVSGDTDAALEKLADWLERAAWTIRTRGEPRPAATMYDENDN